MAKGGNAGMECVADVDSDNVDVEDKECEAREGVWGCGCCCICGVDASDDGRCWAVLEGVVALDGIEEGKERGIRVES